MMMIELTRWIKMKKDRTPQHKTRPVFFSSYQWCVKPFCFFTSDVSGQVFPLPTTYVPRFFLFLLAMFPGFILFLPAMCPSFSSSYQRGAQVFPLQTNDVPKLSSSCQQRAQFSSSYQRYAQVLPLSTSGVSIFILFLPAMSPGFPSCCQ